MAKEKSYHEMKRNEAYPLVVTCLTSAGEAYNINDAYFEVLDVDGTSVVEITQCSVDTNKASAPIDSNVTANPGKYYVKYRIIRNIDPTSGLPIDPAYVFYHKIELVVREV